MPSSHSNIVWDSGDSKPIMDIDMRQGIRAMDKQKQSSDVKIVFKNASRQNGKEHWRCRLSSMSSSWFW
jgi:hypothetical protein